LLALQLPEQVVLFPFAPIGYEVPISLQLLQTSHLPQHSSKCRYGFVQTEPSDREDPASGAPDPCSHHSPTRRIIHNATQTLPSVRLLRLPLLSSQLIQRTLHTHLVAASLTQLIRIRPTQPPLKLARIQHAAPIELTGDLPTQIPKPATHVIQTHRPLPAIPLTLMLQPRQTATQITATLGNRRILRNIPQRGRRNSASSATLDASRRQRPNRLLGAVRDVKVNRHRKRSATDSAASSLFCYQSLNGGSTTRARRLSSSAPHRVRIDMQLSARSWIKHWSRTTKSAGDSAAYTGQRMVALRAKRCWI